MSSAWVRLALSLAFLLGHAESAVPQVRRPPARRPAPRAPSEPVLGVRLLKVGTVDGRSARGQRPYGPMATAVVVEIAAPAAGLTLRLDRATTTATLGDTVLPAAYVFLVGGDTAIVDATATPEAPAWETVIGTDSRQPLGPAVRPVLDLRKGPGVEYRFTRSGVLLLAVVFEAKPTDLTSLSIGGHPLDVARTRMQLTGQWEGSFTWRGVVGVLRFSVDSVSSEVGKLTFGFTCRDSAGRHRRGPPGAQPDLTIERPAHLVPIRADGSFAFEYAPALIGGGSGRFVTADSVTGSFTGGTIGCWAGRPVALKGPWVARRSASWVPPRPSYAFGVDTVFVPFRIRIDDLFQLACNEVRDTGDFVMQPAAEGFAFRPPSGRLQIVNSRYCIWPHGAVHRWLGTSYRIGGPILSIRSDSTAPLRFRVHRDSGYVYVSGKGTVTTRGDAPPVQLPLGPTLVGENPEIATPRR